MRLSDAAIHPLERPTMSSLVLQQALRLTSPVDYALSEVASPLLLQSHAVVVSPLLQR